ncbi:septation ring formation regulator EzrA [Brevibacillus choshinensis]|uniref:Negative regulator of septation ring formation n=1 Tax=Brevibacillus choshinensis TaxID=54911 RepID=A0ABX7FLC6_BRECH|nr:septation ring formation regulator EzrA [Brevibacillus choshinensis]QRG66127.1 negative regulator of septation ring formation [Brevibacillus choshinensis]
MKRSLFMLCLAGMLLYANPAFATPFPDKTDEIVQDADNYLKKEDRTKFADALKANPGSYKVVVVESTTPEADTPDIYAQKLFDNYNLAEDALMVVLDMDTEQLGVYAGPALQSKGANLEMLHDKITSYYEPFRNQKQYLTGIQTMIDEVNSEVDRIKTNQGTANSAAADQSDATSTDQQGAGLGGVPWWIYLIGVVFAGLSVSLVYAMIRRRSIFAQVDDVEDWKDELVEKINVIEVEKPRSRSSGVTEVRYHQLADKKENLLRIRIPDVEMMILDAEEACDRFRFTLALGMLEEARAAIAEIEEELSELKSDSSKVAVTKQENKVVIPEIGKLVEQVERRLSDLRLEYGLSFHELKATLDEVDTMRQLVKTSRAAGDDVHAYETTLKAQQMLESVNKSMEQIPSMVQRINKELPEEFKQLEDGIDQVMRDGFQLEQTALDHSLMQAKQLLAAAKGALEEGSLERVQTHQKAFEVLMDATYQSLEETVLAQREAAAAQVMPAALKADEADEMPVDTLPEVTAEALQQADDTEERDAEEWDAAQVQVEEPDKKHYEAPPTLQAARSDQGTAKVYDYEAEAAGVAAAELSKAEREVLLNAKAIPFPSSTRQAAAPEAPQKEAEAVVDDEEEYELVIPKRPAEWEEGRPEPEPSSLVIETEDDALDELERISGTLVRVRQQIKRSYLPGIPDHLKFLFEEVVQTLARIKTIMEQYRYDLEEVAILIQDADELVSETERMAERIISTCQLAEGAIQYTNRYRRQNRQVNELLTKAEQSFRQLAFAEAYQLAEEARLVVEGAPEETETRWLLRRKKKG